MAPLGDGTGEHRSEPRSTCCACGNARYHMHFKGIWSRQTHPKHFPLKEGMYSIILYDDTYVYNTFKGVHPTSVSDFLKGAVSPKCVIKITPFYRISVQ